MTELEMLHRTILLNPECDTARLVYADALAECGQINRAEFIRDSIASGVILRGLYYEMRGASRAWPTPWPLLGTWAASATVRRGFLETVTITPKYFMKQCIEIFINDPVTRVILAGCGPVPFDGDDPGPYQFVKSRVPQPIWNLLAASDSSRNHKSWPTTQSAWDAMSTACVTYGRKRVNLTEQVKI